MNRAEFIGRLTKDPELNTTPTGISVAKFTIAVDRKFKKQDEEKEADFFNCIAWRGLGENIAKYCRKGSKVFVAGEMQNRSWEKDGEKRYTTELIVNDCEFLTTKAEQQAPTEAPTPLIPDTESELPF